MELGAAAWPPGPGSRPPPRVPPAQCSCARPSLYSGRGSRAFRTRAQRGGSDSGAEPSASGAGVRLPELVRLSPLSLPACLPVFIFHPPLGPGVAHRFWVGLHLQPKRRLQTERALAPGQRPFGLPRLLGRPWVSERCGVSAGGGRGRRSLVLSEPPSHSLSLSQVRAAPSTTMAAAWIPVLCLGGYAPLAAPFPSRQAGRRLEPALVLSSLRRCGSAAAAGARGLRGSR